VPDLAALGWDQDWDTAFAPHRSAGRDPGRVAVQHRGAYDVLTADRELRARLPGRSRRDAATSAELPVVGDWVALDEGPTIRAVLPRRTKFSRRAAQDPGSSAAREQVVASNVDIVFVVASAADDLNPRVLERYLTLVWESGARPVFLLTKADLEADLEPIVAGIAEIGGDVPVHAASSRTGLGLDAVRSYLAPGVTATLLGPSGVGKSTLVNALAGEDLLPTRSVRRDGTGRHTTTRRELIVLPSGGVVIDNPGMRELHLWVVAEGLDEAFEDVVELESQCRFSDCRHESEPGCAVRAALEDGRLSEERWKSYRDLRREVAELEERLARRERSRARRNRPNAGAS
jgi:ribosome biogenesis GTPase / thiamine phosphate phosphatase